MKETIDATKGDLNDYQTKLQNRRSEIVQANNGLGPLRVVRDKLQQRLAALSSRNADRQTAIASAKTAEDANLARERMINLEWETRVEAERLAEQEALLNLATARTQIDELSIQALELHVKLLNKSIQIMEARYRRLTDDQERALQQAAASEQKRSEQVEDPLEKFRARRGAELLELEARVLQLENALTTSPPPALEEMRTLADRARNDFEETKSLLADGRLSHLDALRLNNDFRRIGPERSWIVSHELAAILSQSTFYENALSRVEIDLINDARDDRLELEDLLERLPKNRHAAARALTTQTEAKHRAYLERKRQAFEKLAARAELTHGEITRRLETLDEHYGWIRTHIFWVRDQEPICAATMIQCRREASFLARAVITLFRESFDPSLRGRISVEFVVALVAMVGLPWPLHKLRKSLGSRRLPAARA